MSAAVDRSAGLGWVAWLFLGIGLGAALGGAVSGIATFRFIDDSIVAEGTVVDWTQGDSQGGRRSDPGAYYRVIEVRAPDGQRIRGEVDTGVSMNQLELAERVTVRYRPAEPERMRVASVTGLWLTEIVLALIAIAFGAAGAFLHRQARSQGAVSAERRL